MLKTQKLLKTKNKLLPIEKAQLVTILSPEQTKKMERWVQSRKKSKSAQTKINSCNT